MDTWYIYWYMMQDTGTATTSTGDMDKWYIYWYMMHDTGTGTGDMDTWYIYGYMTPVLVLPVQDTWTHGKRYRYMILVHMHTVVRGASLFNCAWTPAPTTHRPMH